MELPTRLERSPHPYRRASLHGQDTAASSTNVSRLQTPDEDGFEEDPLRFSKALPPPPYRARKGLREHPQDVDLDGVGIRNSWSSTHEVRGDIPGGIQYPQETEVRSRQSRNHTMQAIPAPMIRPLSECLCLSMVALVIVLNQDVLRVARAAQAELFCAGILTLLPLIYRLHSIFAATELEVLESHTAIDLDPASLLYSPSLPILVALSLGPSWSAAIRPAIVLGLASIPFASPPRSSDTRYSLHWLLTLLPLTFSNASRHDSISSSAAEDLLETLAMLFPLHQSLVPILHHLTTTSLLTAELHLLSTSLICLLLLSTSPQMVTLSTVLWIGGLGLYVLCGRVMAWNVMIERIPSMDTRRAARKTLSCHSSTSTLAKESLAANVGSSTDEGAEPKSHSKALSGIPISTEDNAPYSERVERYSQHVAANGEPRVGHSRSKTVEALLALTPRQILARRWFYALYIYAVIIGLVLGPIRVVVSQYALDGWEPFCWAIGYLFGGFDVVKQNVQSLALQDVIPLHVPRDMPFQQLWIDAYREGIEQSNMRLVLFVYWAGVIVLGLCVVLFLLPTMAEVDTRRKVFHGMMVVMLLPTAFVDPCFLSLGLALVLAVFLLLDLIRASQLPPLSKPLARFLTPYVDGRDLRGPVIISHMFLLIGCAIPLWLSLAAYERQAGTLIRDPWQGWELASTSGRYRDLGMVSGVVCVGLGDAAASLVGRRYGRRKWPWSGGKSLEGSAAFAIAVTAGLTLGKLWLVLGGWVPQEHPWLLWMLQTLGKAAVAGCGSSFTEAVLTGANDNVVVPVILWLLVRGLDV